jgi:hypothetical protein
MNIKIIRLKTGEDVIASIDTEMHKGSFVLYYPMEFNIMERSSITKIVLAHYLPYQLISNNFCVVKDQEVLFVMEPKEEFVKYYVESVEKLVQAEQQVSEEQLPDSLVQSLMDMDLEHVTKH